MQSNFQLLGEVSWQEVFALWKANEGADPVWQEFARREKGWGTWEEWRSHQAEQFTASERQWELYEITRPNEDVPKFRMGPFHGWQKHYEEKNTHTFADLVRDHTEWVLGNIGVCSRLENFPQGTQFIGLYFEAEDAVVLYEGHHRAAAIALAVFQGKPVVFKENPTIALTRVAGDAVSFLQAMLQNKSENPLSN